MTEDGPESKIRQLIRESVPTSNKVVDFASAARKLGRPAPRATPKPVQSLTITGNNNAGVFGNSNHIHINVRGTARPRIQVMAGSEEISNEQALEIKRLVAKVVEVSGQTFPKVYLTIYRRFGTTSYLMIKRVHYEEVVSYLCKWIARFTNGAVATDAETQRKQLLKRIHAQARKQSGCIERVRAFAKERFGAATLAALTPNELHDVIAQFRL